MRSFITFLSSSIIAIGMSAAAMVSPARVQEALQAANGNAAVQNALTLAQSIENAVAWVYFIVGAFALTSASVGLYFYSSKIWGWCTGFGKSIYDQFSGAYTGTTNFCKQLYAAGKRFLEVPLPPTEGSKIITEEQLKKALEETLDAKFAAGGAVPGSTALPITGESAETLAKMAEGFYNKVLGVESTLAMLNEGVSNNKALSDSLKETADSFNKAESLMSVNAVSRKTTEAMETASNLALQTKKDMGLAAAAAKSVLTDIESVHHGVKRISEVVGTANTDAANATIKLEKAASGLSETAKGLASSRIAVQDTANDLEKISNMTKTSANSIKAATGNVMDMAAVLEEKTKFTFSVLGKRAAETGPANQQQGSSIFAGPTVSGQTAAPFSTGGGSSTTMPTWSKVNPIPPQRGADSSIPETTVAGNSGRSILTSEVTSAPGPSSAAPSSATTSAPGPSSAAPSSAITSAPANSSSAVPIPEATEFAASSYSSPDTPVLVLNWEEALEQEATKPSTGKARISLFNRVFEAFVVDSEGATQVVVEQKATALLDAAKAANFSLETVADRVKDLDRAPFTIGELVSRMVGAIVTGESIELDMATMQTDALSKTTNFEGPGESRVLTSPGFSSDNDPANPKSFPL